MSKIEEIISSPEIEHYKNLSNLMKEFKRVHIDSYFVMLFKFEKNSEKIKFEDLQHHDIIYRN
ncbi:MAG: hypothetical protein NUV57_04120 [archaeon]|nr:hypothetical protein [archaeon]